MTRLSSKGVPRQRTLAGKAICPNCKRLIVTTVTGAFVFHKCRTILAGEAYDEAPP